MSTKVLHRSLSSIHILYNQALVGGLSMNATPTKWIPNIQLNGGSSRRLQRHAIAREMHRAGDTADALCFSIYLYSRNIAATSVRSHAPCPCPCPPARFAYRHGDLQKFAKASTLQHSLFAAFNTD